MRCEWHAARVTCAESDMRCGWHVMWVTCDVSEMRYEWDATQVVDAGVAACAGDTEIAGAYQATASTPMGQEIRKAAAGAAQGQRSWLRCGPVPVWFY